LPDQVEGEPAGAAAGALAGVALLAVPALPLPLLAALPPLAGALPPASVLAAAGAGAPVPAAAPLLRKSVTYQPEPFN
jgi:hypothetical protein